jgi:uncharacterized protein (DUF305 family)
MKTLNVALAAASMLWAGSALAQSGSNNPATGQPIELPSSCREAAQNTSMGGGDMQGMMASMDDAHKSLMQAMQRMNPAMMQGIMVKDTDLAFTCGMMAHHLGAIEMAKVEIKYGKDAEMKRMAEKTIKEQEAEVVEMKSWIGKHAGR